ncbi:hypothetical protein [Paraburkholderia sartisoli]|uniref:4-amino-4-deoxy-L-arabinose transferase n=1 Tax=Paraburkholderia sartisoli TaxID=83784 RepID=A0A1H4EEI6_9BURK|nr:hypothetical protein [Paraburkholderia sartisoli]SEA83465.1 hypothetical protein SAMN05192564_103308 [Paraburkholderia sartisoli]
MSSIFAASGNVVASRDIGLSLQQILFLGTVVLAGALFWVAPRPPMGDLAQHAGQVATLRDLLDGTSPWTNLVYINYFTPYLLGYAIAVALSFFMPVLVAMKLSLTLAFYAFMLGCVCLRRRFNADPRLDWLCVPGFFGFAFQFGFFTFLMAAPVGLFFLVVASRFANAPTHARGAAVVGMGVLAFFSHGLVFAFACATGGALVPVMLRGMRRILLASVPYALLGALALVYMLYVKQHHLVTWTGEPHTGPNLVWDWTNTSWGWHRSFNFLLYVFAVQMKDGYFLLAGMFMLAAPWLMGARLNRKTPAAFVPMLAMLVVWVLVPSAALDVEYMYHRFALYLLPAYALMFARPDVHDESAKRGNTQAPHARFFMRIAPVALIAICWSFFGVLAEREARFAAANASFETLLEVTEPGQRALSLVYDPASTIVHNPYTLHGYPQWYEAEQQGFVDFSFAYLLPQIVRFKPGHVPAMRPEFSMSPERFDWKAVQGSVYRYFFVHHVRPLPEHMFDNDECQVVLRAEAGDWSLFESIGCRQTALAGQPASGFVRRRTDAGRLFS